MNQCTIIVGYEVKHNVINNKLNVLKTYSHHVQAQKPIQNVIF